MYRESNKKGEGLTMEQSFELQSEFTNYCYTIHVYVPDGVVPEQGFPVIYLLDGGWYFDFAKNIVKLQSRNHPKTCVQPSIVVAISHREEDVRSRRFYDFTAPAKQYIFPERTKGKHMDTKEYGGAEHFFTFLQQELKPRIYEDFVVNHEKETLYGHSLGGYFAIWCYLKQHEAFTHYAAISPSVWWNDMELMRFIDQQNTKQQHSLFVAVGEHESFMVTESKQFIEKLASPEAMYYVAPDENHASIVPTTMSRAFRSIIKK